MTSLILTVIQVSSQAQVETKINESPLNPEEQQEWLKVLNSYDYTAIAAAYADYMIEHGRDRYGTIHSPLFVSAMDRKTVTVFKHGKALYPHVIAKPYAPGLRRDHKMRPTDRTYSGGNPMEDLPLYNLLYRLSDLTGLEHYAEEADKSIAWFLENGQSPVTGLYCWGSHMYWDVHKDQPIYANTGSPDGGYGGHEYGNDDVWTRWEQNPEALTRFAHGIWKHQITDQETGRFSRHADYHQHNPGQEWYDFPGIASAFIEVWSREYGANGHLDMKLAIQTLLEHYRSMRHPETGAMSWCTAEGPDRREVSNVSMNLYMATNVQDAAALLENRDPELAREMREFVLFMDDEYLSNDYDKILDVADKGILSWYTIAERTCMPKGFTPPPEGVDASVGYPLKTIDGTPAASLYYLTPWFPGRSYAEFSLLLRNRYERCEEKHKSTYRRALLDIADIYMSISPEVQFAQYPDNISDVVELLRFVYKLTDEVAYLHRADQMMRLGLQLFFDETSPLPKITNFDDWYESSTKNESSVEILSQMLELSLDLEGLPEKQRTAPQVRAQKQSGMWYAEPSTASTDVILRYGDNKAHGLYLFQTRDSDEWKVSLSDVITRIPTIEEADELNGRMDKFTGKGNATTNILYGGFKDIPRQVTLVIRNTGKKAATVKVTASLHDTYHDNGQVQDEKTLKPGEEGAFVLNASSLKWLRSLWIKSSNKVDGLQLKSFAFEMVPRSQLTQTKKQDAKNSIGAEYGIGVAFVNE